MTKKTIITCAVTGAGPITERSRHVPITPKQIAQASVDAAKAGAAVVHIHVRHPETGAPSMDVELYRETVDRIRQSGSDVLINLTSGVGARYVPDTQDPAKAGPGTNFRTPEARVEHIVEIKPEICSLDVGSLNFARHVVINTPDHLSTMAQLIRDAGVKPEIEVFELGHIRLAKKMIEDGDIIGTPLFQFCLGIPWGAEANSQTMLTFLQHIPNGADWGGFGISTAIWPMVAQSALLGGNVRVGLEDSLYIRRGELAESNAQLVEHATKIVDGLNGEIASPVEARAILDLKGR